ncbi:MAG: alpha/beta hydrolase [Lysinibacillus sp.]
MNDFSMNSRFTNALYDIKIYMPDAQAPAGGFPVYYVLDGLSYFGFVKDAVRLQQLNRMKTGMSPAIVVGICHREEEMRERRFIDYTAPAEELRIPARAKGKIPAAYGGAEQFHRFIEQELIPVIEEEYPVNPEQRTLFGHSLGGYFALWSLFTQGGTFKHTIAISPSIWWNGEELMEMGTRFIANGGGEKNPHIFMAVGEQEGFMVEDAKKLSAMLGVAGLQVECYVAPEENHASVVPTVVSRALRSCSKSEQKALEAIFSS